MCREEDNEEDVPQEADMPVDARAAAEEAVKHHHPDSVAQGAASSGGLAPPEEKEAPRKRSLSKMAKSAIFREVWLDTLSACCKMLMLGAGRPR